MRNEGWKDDDDANLLDAEQLFGSECSPGGNDSTANEAEQRSSRATAGGATNAPMSQTSRASATAQVATQPLPNPNPVQPLQAASAEQSQQEQPHEQAMPSEQA